MTSQPVASVRISPAGGAEQRPATWPGISVDLVHVPHHGRITIQFPKTAHVLAAYRIGARNDGESRLDGVVASRLKNIAGKLTFVPSGHTFCEWHDLPAHSRMTFVSIDPAFLRECVDETDAARAPRLFFEDACLWKTVSKLGAAIDGLNRDGGYLEALGRTLLHELPRPQLCNCVAEPCARGGLAAWQQRVVLDYIEQHLCETLELSTLAELVRLSPPHLCRAFKQSVGHPPLRYQCLLRVERAKQLLAQSGAKITEIGLELGYGEASSFTTAFRKATGMAPRAYRRGLA